MSAHALSLRTLQVSINPDATDRFQIVGEVMGGLSLDGVDTVTLTLHRFSFDVPVTDKARKHRKLMSRSAAPGLTHFTLDLRRGRFVATGVGLALGGLPNPMTVRMIAGAAVDCATVRLGQRTRGHRAQKKSSHAPPIHLVLGRDQPPASCKLVDIKLVDPLGIPAGTPTPVLVVAGPPAGDVAAGSVQLFRVDATGTPLGTPLCDLHDDGAAGDAIGRDRLYTCLVTLGDTMPTTIPLVVQATVDGVLVTSTGFSVTVVPPAGPSDADTAVALQEQADATWIDASGRLGDTLAARVETVRRLRTMPGIADATISGDDITIHFSSGITGSLMLSPRPDAALQLPSADVQSGGPVRTSARAAADAAPVATGSLVGNTNVLLWDAGFFADTVTELPAIRNILGLSGDPAFTVTMRGPAQATVESLRDLTSFGTVAFVTHGVRLDDGRIAFLTAERATPTLVGAYFTELRAGWLAISGAFAQGEGAQYLSVAPGFISHLSGHFANAMIYAGFCNGLRNATLFTSFRLHGASVFWGFDRPVGTSFAAAVGPKIFCGMVSDHVSAAAAFAPIDPKTDPGFLHPRQAARLEIAGDTSVAYPGTLGPPADFSLDPPQACLMPGESALYSAMPATGPSPLAPCVTYKWTNTARAGRLTSAHSTGADAFSTTDSMATYQRTVATSASDTIGVTVVDINQTTLGTAQALALSAADPPCMTTSTTSTTTTTGTTTSTMCVLPPPSISRCADFTISPEVVAPGGTFTISIDYHSDGGPPCNNSACVYCGGTATLQTVDGMPNGNPDGCGVPVGTHTAVFKAANYERCPAACFFAEPGNWGTTHYFAIAR